MLRNTLDGIEALAALAQFGTVSEAAIRLRLTQSAVTKRIQALARSSEHALVERDGRRLMLTAHGLSLLERAKPLLADLRGLSVATTEPAARTFSVAIADSIAASWGPAVLAAALREVPDISVRVHAHRSVLLVENVRLGRYQIGITTDVPAAKDLIHHALLAEPMAIVASGERERRVRDAPLITIEATSMTWRAIEPLLRAHHPELLKREIVAVETFSAAMQMVKAGFGDALAPLGLVREMKIRRHAVTVLPQVARSVTLLARKTTNQSESYTRLRNAVTAAAARYFRALR